MAAPADTAVAAVCDCGREFLATDEQSAWKMLQAHIEEWAKIDDPLHGLKEFVAADRPGIRPLTPDEVLATHAEDLEHQWQLMAANEPSADRFNVWASHLMKYLSLTVHRQHPEKDWNTCTNPACVWARAVVGNEN